MRWTPTRAKAHDTIASPNSLETRVEVKGRWTPTGSEPMEQWINCIRLQRK